MVLGSNHPRSLNISKRGICSDFRWCLDVYEICSRTDAGAAELPIRWARLADIVKSRPLQERFEAVHVFTQCRQRAPTAWRRPDLWGDASFVGLHLYAKKDGRTMECLLTLFRKKSVPVTNVIRRRCGKLVSKKPWSSYRAPLQGFVHTDVFWSFSAFTFPVRFPWVREGGET